MLDVASCANMFDLIFVTFGNESKHGVSKELVDDEFLVTGKPTQQLLCAYAVQLVFFRRTDTRRLMNHNHPGRMPLDCRSDIPL